MLDYRNHLYSADEIINRTFDLFNNQYKQITAMDGHVQHELSRARLASQYLVNSDLPHTLQRVVDTIKKIPDDRSIAWHIDVPDRFELPVDRQDLSEVLGNVLDNARKWTRSSISIEGRESDGQFVLQIEDDGPGVQECAYPTLTRRGHRLDDEISGSGLGLAITKEIMTAYGGDVRFYPAAGGGLGVSLNWTVHRN